MIRLWAAITIATSTATGAALSGIPPVISSSPTGPGITWTERHCKHPGFREPFCYTVQRSKHPGIRPGGIEPVKSVS